jgi:hypothetical protein
MGQDQGGRRVLVEAGSIYWIAAASPDRILRPEFTATAKRVLLPPDAPSAAPGIEALRRTQDAEIQGIRPWTDQRHGLAPLLLRALRGQSVPGS